MTSAAHGRGVSNLLKSFNSGSRITNGEALRPVLRCGGWLKASYGRINIFMTSSGSEGFRKARSIITSRWWGLLVLN
ncbi:hypothetical protein FOQG_17720 [Fusarium oxysporum f. sp. raphani 54005]|uniref:Uncharacterized protein n=2 Tax=Fusarium oxysporum TaxID=5507 RepID=W9HDV6_FUSOX|nr:hypothetical protein FOYG_17620 [Fusarium oxysporum NRRL 32931]EXK77573.1 hypothetical protein FOQG_17720 [Fusarium oxysporum f. sp. raphani 54005]